MTVENAAWLIPVTALTGTRVGREPEAKIALWASHHPFQIPPNGAAFTAYPLFGCLLPDLDLYVNRTTYSHADEIWEALQIFAPEPSAGKAASVSDRNSPEGPRRP